MPRWPKQTLEQRFWSKVNRQSDGCWLWTAANQVGGYGIFMLWNPKRLVRAHRLAWELTNGKIPDGLWVLHKCDNPCCVRPDHLFLGNNTDNVRDMLSKGRGNSPKGEQHFKCKMTVHRIVKLRLDHASGRFSQRELAAKYGISRTAIRQAIAGVTWAHVKQGQNPSVWPWKKQFTRQMGNLPPRT